MAVELILVPEAERDLMQAYSWYEHQRVGLGEEFLSCVDASLQTITRHPDMYATVHKDYRRALVRRFPYGIFYEHVSNSVTIYAIFHTAANPEKWRLRLS